ncbi:hypothetical protein CBR_g3607 [Chara braunii]|uniref:inositol-1,3,4-trisphosphate 5/6-kinase n=1 Tax=Chara braunii TaxID=69332 RepID=A0A388KFS9_CHABU|nr:hypothetical protein CBR_g3607 [Chara braunii]|eukprot:GBG68908.1 hypothetical protein CBR_g3607 [Chara braunii]
MDSRRQSAIPPVGAVLLDWQALADADPPATSSPERNATSAKCERGLSASDTREGEEHRRQFLEASKLIQRLLYAQIGVGILLGSDTARASYNEESKSLQVLGLSDLPQAFVVGNDKTVKDVAAEMGKAGEEESVLVVISRKWNDEHGNGRQFGAAQVLAEQGMTVMIVCSEDKGKQKEDKEGEEESSIGIGIGSAATDNLQIRTIVSLSDVIPYICKTRKQAVAGDVVVVGHVMKWDREKSFLKRGALPLAVTAGLTFVPIDVNHPALDRHLDDVRLLLHKATDEIASVSHTLAGQKEGHRDGANLEDDENRDEKEMHCIAKKVSRVKAVTESRVTFSNGMTHLWRLAKASRHICVIDPFEFVEILVDRVAMMNLLQGLKAVATPNGTIVRAPVSVSVCSFAEAVAREALSQAKLEPPWIVKPRIACGIPDAHTMAFVRTRAGIADLKLPLPAVIQEYVDHGSVQYKVYVIGERVFVCTRNSTPDAAQFIKPTPLSESCQSTSMTFHSLRSLPLGTPRQSGATVAGSRNDKDEAAKDGRSSSSWEIRSTAPAARRVERGQLDEVAVWSAAKWLSRLLKLHIFGFDVVVQSLTGDHVVVDANYFPSFKDVPDQDSLPAFWDCLREAYRGWQNQRTKNE